MRHIESREIRLIHKKIETLKTPVDDVDMTSTKEPAISEEVKEIEGVTVLHEDFLPERKPPIFSSKRKIVWEQ
jgi:hypothetical protein